jgi:putative transposase
MLDIQLAQAEPAHSATSNAQDSAEKSSIFMVTALTIYRRKLFLDHEHARAIARCHHEITIWGRSRCLAWVLMPDCWQALVQLSSHDSLPNLMRRFKAISASKFDAACLKNGYLWGRGYRECAIQNQQDLQELARHIVMHPVRMGLVQRCGDYPYWNADWL